MQPCCDLKQKSGSSFQPYDHMTGFCITLGTRYCGISMVNVDSEKYVSNTEEEDFMLCQTNYFHEMIY